ncbi:Exonuclease SbcC [Streptomyces misionensis JCM 4497]
MVVDGRVVGQVEGRRPELSGRRPVRGGVALTGGPDGLSPAARRRSGTGRDARARPGSGGGGVRARLRSGARVAAVRRRGAGGDPLAPSGAGGGAAVPPRPRGHRRTDPPPRGAAPGRAGHRRGVRRQEGAAARGTVTTPGPPR